MDECGKESKSFKGIEFCETILIFGSDICNSLGRCRALVPLTSNVLDP